MGILYGMVARGEVVLAEFSATQSNASVVAKQILSKINVGDDNNKDSNVSFSHDRYVFHVKRTDGLTVLCMADDAFGRMIPFAFLEDIHKKFVKTYGRAILSSPAYAMNDEFSRILSQQMDYYSNDPNADRLNRLKGEMTQVRTVMVDNIEKVLERGGRLELLVEKTSAMNNNSIRFRKHSRRYKNNLWWSNVRLTLALIIVFIVVSYVILAFLCRGPLLTNCLR
ncbi:vesicle-associated membrane protein 711 [Vigna radiata var. radiata]|uniref:Vesicle-associated membrane protein 711 n=1 Tax=Vigna radiata var. radiata TaxID=3916 RepID=A0A1S3UQ88_VIGRR|nr:vesicle-associated membrane protein 711 [Vigna radiata var. radiata]